MRLMSHSTVICRKKQPCSPGNGKQEYDVHGNVGFGKNMTFMSEKTAQMSDREDGA